MSWATVSSALQSRINTVCTGAPTPANVQRFLRWTNDGPDGATFQNLFAAGGRLASCQLTRTGRRTIRAKEDSRKRVQHDVKAELTLALDDADSSELLHQALVDLVLGDLEDGDRTLGGVAITHTEARAENIQVVTNAARVVVHSAELLFTVEEVAGTRSTPALYALADLGTGLKARQLEQSMALVEWLAIQPLITGLGLVQLQLDPSGAPHPRYPLDPVNDLPALFVVNHTGQNQRTVGGGRDSTYQLSLYYYRRQTPGQQHQEKLGEALRAIETLLLRNPRPMALEIVAADMATPGKVDWPDQLVHPLTDDPRLRVSCGELLIQIQSKE